MSKEEDQKQFEKAIQEDRYDECLHRVYADFLEEQGQDSLSAFHRKWSKEWQEAFDWMENFARVVVSEGRDFYGTGYVTVDELMDALRQYQKDGRLFCLRGMGFGPDNALFNDPPLREKLWQCYSILEGCEVEDRESPFGCCI